MRPSVQTVLKTKCHPSILEARLRNLFSGGPIYTSPPLAHHGIQRNGTNFLGLCLIELGVTPVNLGPLSTSDRRHKHTRWYRRHKVPSFLAGYAARGASPVSVSELNLRAGFKEGTRHLVVKKSMPEALASILNYGLRVGWFQDENKAESALPQLASDFEAYHAFWDALQQSTPTLVELISFEKVASASNIREKLAALGIVVAATRETFSYRRVPVTPQSRFGKVFSAARVTKLLPSPDNS